MEFLGIQLHKDLINFIWVVLFSLLIGLEQRVHHEEEDERSLFGTDRTFTLIGIFGYVLYVAGNYRKGLYLAGLFILTLLLLVYYLQKIKIHRDFGLTSVFAALITYLLPPLIYSEDKVLVLSVFVSVLILIEMKQPLRQIAKTFDSSEFLTLSKFIILSGVILPLLPETKLADWLPVSLYNIWLAVVAVSGISYLSYILQKFVFPRKGLILSAILGGFYSSTATTFILAKKTQDRASKKILAAILAATGMMFIRIWLLALIFNRDIAIKLLPYLSFLFVLTFLLVFYLWRKGQSDERVLYSIAKNPLELKTAFLFALIFVIFSIIIHFMIEQYGHKGMGVLAFLTGLTDVDPFILNILQSTDFHFSSVDMLSKWIMLAIASNNLMKMLYSIFMGFKAIRKPILIYFGIIVIFNFLLIIFI